MNPNSEDEIEIIVNNFDWIDLIGGDFQPESQYGKNRLNFRIDPTLLSKQQLRIIRNAFYAKWNLKFKSSELTEYFKENMVGYEPLHSNVDNKLTDIQKKAIEIIREEEDKRPY